MEPIFSEAVESRGGFELFSQAALRFFVATVAVVLSAQCVSAQALKITDFETVVKPFTDQHCIDCHGPDRVEGKFRIDKLMEGAHIKSEAEAERWQEVLDLINTGDMPPPEEDEPEKEELVAMLSALYKTTARARDIIASKGSGVMRRMNSREYANAVYDLLGVRFDEDLLPQDSRISGFDTEGYDLSVTTAEVEGYLAAGNEIVDSLINQHLSGKKLSPQLKQIFGDIPEEPKSRDADGLIERFVAAIFVHQPPPEKFAKNLGALFRSLRRRNRDADFWEVAKVPMAAALASPSFVYILEEKKELSQLEVATRLALMLWSSVPDEELIGLAKSEQLLNDLVLEKQFSRMLKDPKADRFFNSFVDQWLELDRLDNIAIDPDLYPDLKKNEDRLKLSMKRETIAFVKEVVNKNMRAKNLISSDFTMLDSTLARHYGISFAGGGSRGGSGGFVPDPFSNEPAAPPRKKKRRRKKKEPEVETPETAEKPVRLPKMQKVELTGEDKVRGGLLGHGSIQTLTSNGSRTSPVERGVYILRKLLDQPPPPAPADVPEAEDVPGENQTTRELLKHHMTTAQCASCHAKIDPLGFGMESFGPLGRWRTTESGVALDTSGRLTDGTEFKGYDGLKEALIDRDERVAQSFTKAALAYGLGRKVRFRDRGEVNEILKQSKNGDYRLREILLLICKSDKFRSKN